MVYDAVESSPIDNLILASLNQEEEHLISSDPVINTKLSKVAGDIGELTIAGYLLQEVAQKLCFEETIYLLWYGYLPKLDQLKSFKEKIAQKRQLPNYIIEILKIAAHQDLSVIDALRTALSSLPCNSSGKVSYEKLEDDAVVLIALFPSIVATYWRLKQGQELVSPLPELDHTANYLYMLFARIPSAEETRTLEIYLNSVVEHSVNASTLTGRVIISTQADVISAVVGALCALKGPLHGGAPGPALKMILELVEDKSMSESYLRDKLDKGERLMGFGHRVYRTLDPRATVLAFAFESMCRAKGDLELFNTAKYVEELALKLLHEYKPHRELKTNVEYYTALVLYELGIHPDLFTPTFAISRVAGWTAHCFEQQEIGRLIRAKGFYLGPALRTWVPLRER
jgi:citrate synthase